MKLTVFGATGKTGKEIVRQALAAGHEVTAVARDPAKLGEAASKVRIVQGDAMDMQVTEQAVAGADAVLSVLGHVKGSPPDVLSKSGSNIVGAMKKQNVRRLVVLTNIAARDSKDRPGLYNRFLRALLTLFRGQMARDTAEEAKIISQSDLDWTIVRASLLTDGPMTGKYHVGEFDKSAGTQVSRANVGAFVIDCATENKYLRAKPLISE
jgi:putative NADH-flavin reductase